MLSHLFESTTTPIITKIIQFCYLTFLAAGRWRDRPSSIPDAKPAIALLELVKKCDRFLAIFDYMERAIPYGIAPLHGMSGWTGAIVL